MGYGFISCKCPVSMPETAGVDRNVLRPLRSNEAKKTYQDGLFYGELPSILFVVGALAAR